MGRAVGRLLSDRRRAATPSKSLRGRAMLAQLALGVIKLLGGPGSHELKPMAFASAFITSCVAGPPLPSMSMGVVGPGGSAAAGPATPTTAPTTRAQAPAMKLFSFMSSPFQG
ncbi:hypothetical protein Pflav_022300 [Phytohabitans flavus]|uniref:Uncharacterized protein n=1 Tax=Phytohabitans flavus TaxID=1076124 RepID=A0A6F8XPT0_9ACTN|nr:hypothetical protein [Phytohabitans flavus]BCB75820.1 hypothetical protein Pflav_022300 [Phytohabitans flavus]